MGLSQTFMNNILTDQRALNNFSSFVMFELEIAELPERTLKSTNA